MFLEQPKAMATVYNVLEVSNYPDPKLKRFPMPRNGVVVG